MVMWIVYVCWQDIDKYISHIDCITVIRKRQLDLLIWPSLCFVSINNRIGHNKGTYILRTNNKSKLCNAVIRHRNRIGRKMPATECKANLFQSMSKRSSFIIACSPLTVDPGAQIWCAVGFNYTRRYQCEKTTRFPANTSRLTVVTQCVCWVIRITWHHNNSWPVDAYQNAPR